MIYMRPLHPGEQIWKDVIASSSLIEIPQEGQEEEVQEVSSNMEYHLISSFLYHAQDPSYPLCDCPETDGL